MEISMIAKQESDLFAIAQEIITKFSEHRIFALDGPMGVGKTTFVKSVGKVLEVTDVVNSPTFSLVNQYGMGNGEVMFHFDLYRIEKISELYDIGYEEYLFSGNYCFLEWPEKMTELLPESCVYIRIRELDDGSRRFEVKDH
jgi:tRNA threonylcarbamoyladenosine biosynthesis protein TsaE